MEISIRLIIYVIINGLISYNIPLYAYKYAEYKQKKKAKDMPLNGKSLTKRLKIYAMILSMIYAYISYSFLGTKELVFASIFMFFAVFGVCVDTLIRIIGNEMLLIMLFPALIYRIYMGGFRSFIGSIISILIIILFYLAAGLLTYLHKGLRGIGMGDVKLSMVIAIAVGFPGVISFMGAMAISILLYLFIRFIREPLFIRTIFCPWNTFPMCAPIMAGFLFAIISQSLFCRYDFCRELLTGGFSWMYL